MRLFSTLEQRLASADDTRTRRFQKLLVVVTALVGSAATVVNAVPFFADDLPALAWTYMGSAAVLLTGSLLILGWPGLFVPVTYILLVNLVVTPTATQILSGGLTSGVLAMQWTMFAPLGAALALGARAALTMLGLFAVSVLVAAALEPVSRGMAPDIELRTIVAFDIGSLLSFGVLATAASIYLLRQVERFRESADRLLVNVLPGSIADRLKEGEAPIADGYDDVTILFVDIVGFTELASEADPADVVRAVGELFTEFDTLTARHGAEKIKTIGDAYMAVAGLPEPRPDHAAAMLGLAQAMVASVARYPDFLGKPLALRVGLHCGPVVAGVIGRQRLIYDLWGDTVNVASRMESTGLPGRIQVTQQMRDRLIDRYQFERREAVSVKGKGLTATYLLVG